MYQNDFPVPPMASIDIRTTQNVTIEYELASLRERFFSFFIDLVIYYIGYFFFWVAVVSIVSAYIDQWGFMFIAMTMMVGLVFYHFVFEVFGGGRSLGKRAMNIRVVRLDGQEPGLGDHLMRSLFLVMDFFLSFGVLGAVLIGSTHSGQRLGDLAANTTVVRGKSQLHFQLKDILNIQSLDNYEPQYPAVRQMNEQDMLLVKNVLNRYQNWQNPAHAEAVRSTVEVVCQRLGIEPPSGNKIDFLKTLIRDYIVLTR